MYEFLARMDPEARRMTTELLLKDKIVGTDLSNVADYFNRHDREVWSVDEGHFPQCIPPWPFAWLEWQTDGVVSSKELGERKYPPKRFAVKVMRGPVSHDPRACEEAAAAYFAEMPKTIQGGGDLDAQLGRMAEPFLQGAALMPRARHFVVMMVFWAPKQAHANSPLWRQPWGLVFVVLDDRGDVLPMGDWGVFGAVATAPQEWTGLRAGEHHAAVVHDIQAQAVNVVLLGFSLANCSNVVVEEARQPRAVRRRLGRQNDPAANVTYRTLRIEPMTAAGRSSAEKRESSGASPLHICRGHFKDYRDKGLFGQHKGVYWWESHIRGHADSGRVHKDYSVRAQ